MKIQIETLTQKMQGRKLNIYQEADALIEFNKLTDYVEEMERKIEQIESQKDFCKCEKPKANYPEMIWCDICTKVIDWKI